MEGRRDISRKRGKRGKNRGRKKAADIKFEPAHKLFGREAKRLFNTFGHHHDPVKLETRINELKQLVEQNSKGTFEWYGLVNYRSTNAPSIDGVIQSKEDFRLDEVNLTGERALPASYEVPAHPLTLLPVEELDIVKDGLISVEDVQGILDSVKADDFGKSVWTIALTCPGLDREMTAEEKSRLRETIQLLVGIRAEVFYRNDELCIQKYVRDPAQRKRTKLPWLWPKPYLRVIATGILHHNHFQRFLKKVDMKVHPVFECSHTELRTKISHIFVQVNNVEPDLIADIFLNRVANYTFTEDKVMRGVYKGNIFRFAVRNLKNSQEELTTIMQDFQDNGYINYFNVSMPNCGLIEPGKKFTRGKYKFGFEALLRPFAHPQKAKLEEAKALFFVFQDAKPLAKLNRVGSDGCAPTEQLFHEIAAEGVLSHQTALNILKNTDLAVTIAESINTFLDFIWNQTVNKLIENRGLKLAVGDLVFVDEAAEKRVLYRRQYGACITKRSAKKENDICKDTRNEVKALTQEDITSEKYTIFDLVIPVCGIFVTWPQNDIGNYIDEVLKENEIIKGKTHFRNMRLKELPVIIHGTYRKVLCKPENLKWWTKEYVKPNDPLVLDDLPVTYHKKLAKSLKAVKDNRPVKITVGSLSSEEDKDDSVAENKIEESINDSVEDAKIEVKNVEENSLKKSDEGAAKNKDEKKTSLIVELFIPKTTHLSAPIRELFKKNEFGSAFYRIGESHNIRSDLVENVIDGLKEYTQKVATVKEENERKRTVQADNMDAAGRIEILERELAVLRKERELVELRREIIGRGSRERRFRDESPRRHRSRSRDRYQLRYDDRSPYPPSRRSNSRDRFNARYNSEARDRYDSGPSSRHLVDRYSPRDRLSFESRGSFSPFAPTNADPRRNFGFDFRGQSNVDPWSFKADPRGISSPDVRGQFNADQRRNFGTDFRGPFNADPRGSFSSSGNNFNANPQFGRSLFGPSEVPQGDTNGQERLEGMKRMRLDLNHSADDKLYNPFDDFKGGARNITETWNTAPFGHAGGNFQNTDDLSSWRNYVSNRR